MAHTAGQPKFLEVGPQATPDQRTAASLVNTALKVYRGRLNNQQLRPGKWEIYDLLWMDETLDKVACLWPPECRELFNAGRAEIGRLTRETHNLPVSFY